MEKLEELNIMVREIMGEGHEEEEAHTEDGHGHEEETHTDDGHGHEEETHTET